MSVAIQPLPATAELIAYPDSTERRLRRALRKLDAALADQREAVATFRTQLGALNGAVVQLGDRAESLRGALAGAAAEAERARAASRDLMVTAERMEALARR
jgi:chromosome segregation ATPase